MAQQINIINKFALSIPRVYTEFISKGQYSPHQKKERVINMLNLAIGSKGTFTTYNGETLVGATILGFDIEATQDVDEGLFIITDKGYAFIDDNKVLAYYKALVDFIHRPDEGDKWEVVHKDGSITKIKHQYYSAKTVLNEFDWGNIKELYTL